MKYFDTHAHYNDEKYDGILEETLKKCKEANVKYIINVGYNKKSSKKAIELSYDYDYMYSAIGVHPHDVNKDNAVDIYDLYNQNVNKKIVAIGEIGLDYAFVKDNKKEQEKLFISQIELANTLKLPVIIHTRDASFDTYQVLRNNKPHYGLLFHCFHPTDDLVNMVLENGYTVAFGGNITYKRNNSFGNYMKKIPITQIVIETDSPYLPPEPYRGTINASYNLPIICKKLSEYLQIENETLNEQLFINSKRFFNIK